MRFRLSLLLLPLLILSACINPFNPQTRPGTHQDAYPNTSPELVLRNLELSYRQKDLELYKKCLLASEYRFELISSEADEINAGVDIDHDGITDSWWGYQKEVEYHTHLFRDGSTDLQYPSPEQIFLNLQIPAPEQWEMDTQVGHEGWVIVACLFDLQLSFAQGNSKISANGAARFFLKPVRDNRGVDHWYIAIWRDESNI
jgi:hypothetical protein